MPRGDELDEQPIPLIFASMCGSTADSYSALTMWLVMELWPHPAHNVVGAPLYTSRARPMRLTLRGAIAML